MVKSRLLWLQSEKCWNRNGLDLQDRQISSFSLPLLFNSSAEAVQVTWLQDGSWSQSTKSITNTWTVKSVHLTWLLYLIPLNHPSIHLLIIRAHAGEHTHTHEQYSIMHNLHCNQTVFSPPTTQKKAKKQWIRSLFIQPRKLLSFFKGEN